MTGSSRVLVVVVLLIVAAVAAVGLYFWRARDEPPPLPEPTQVHVPDAIPVENVTVESLQAVFDQIDNWEDTRDFRFMDLHWMLALGQGDTPTTQLSPEVITAIA